MPHCGNTAPPTLHRVVGCAVGSQFSQNAQSNIELSALDTVTFPP